MPTPRALKPSVSRYQLLSNCRVSHRATEPIISIAAMVMAGPPAAPGWAREEWCAANVAVQRQFRFDPMTFAAEPERPQSVPRSSSLMPTFARVCASTRFTITAQYSEYRPFEAGSEPGTTTAPAGMRP